MTDWILWFAAAGALAIFELFSGTFYLLMIAIGFGAGGALAMAGAETSAQMIVAAVVGVIATYVLRSSRFGRRTKTDAARDPNVNLDIGQTLQIRSWSEPDQGRATARVMYRGAMWDAELVPGQTAQPGVFVIREIRGSRLIVANAVHHHS